MWAVLQQVVQDTVESGPFDMIYSFLDTPAPYSPFSEYLAVMFLLWLLARRGKKETFERQAQDVLEEKYRAGEINKKTYDKFRQDASVRSKR
ncbi:MAG: hypothetical protein ABIV28_04505 [Longimicrobiales bacterium]